MKMILRNLRGMWRTERLLLFIMVLCIFSSALLMQFSYGLYQNYHVVVQESTDDFKQLDLLIAEGQQMKVGVMRDYIRALPPEITADANIIYTVIDMGCPADHIQRTDAEWESLRQEYAPFEIDEETDQKIWAQLEGIEDDEERAKKLKELSELYRQKDIQHMHIETDIRFTYQNGDFAPCPIYEENVEKNRWFDASKGDRHFTKEEYASGAHVVYNEGNEDTFHYLMLDEKHVSLWGEPYEIIIRNGMGAMPEPPVTAVPADAAVNSGSRFSFGFDHNLTKQGYDTMKSLSDEMMPGMLIFPDLPFPDNDAVYVSRNIMLIAALIAVLSVLNFVLLYQFLLQKRARTLSIFRITGCTASRAMRMYLGECFTLGIPFYFAGLGVFLLLMKHVFADIFPYMAGAFSLEVYAEIFAVWLISMLVLLIITVTLHVRKSILNTFYGREDA